MSRREFQEVARKSLYNIRLLGVGGSLRSIGLPRLRRLLIDRALHRLSSLTFAHALDEGVQICLTAEQWIASLTGTCPEGSLAQEATEVETHIIERMRNLTGSRYESSWSIDTSMARGLYMLSRMARPSVLLESGVASGHSTTLLLEATHRNGAGKLHSIDIQSDVGALLTPEERARWTLHVLPRAYRRNAFVSIANRCRPVDLFVHDSEHTYGWQRFEYEAIYGRMDSGGLLISDDVHESNAFLDFCRSRAVRPCLLITGTKVVGAAHIPPHDPVSTEHTDERTR